MIREARCCENPWPQRDPHEGGWRCGNCLESLAFFPKSWLGEGAEVLQQCSNAVLSEPLRKPLLELTQRIRDASRPHGC